MNALPSQAQVAMQASPDMGCVPCLSPRIYLFEALGKKPQTGIRVLSDEERRATPGRPWLYIHVTASKRDNSGLYAYNVNVGLRQDTWLVRDLAIEGLGATTWDTGVIGSIGAAKIREVREDVLDLVDQFINGVTGGTLR
jgi:hypothetical protein